MNSAQVLTHPAFVRPPVLNARRRGPTPSGIPMLSRERFERGYAKQKAEEASLRVWAREHANAHWPLDRIRREKQWSDAKDVLERRDDGIWQKIEQLEKGAAALLNEAAGLKFLLLERQLGEHSHE